MPDERTLQRRLAAVLETTPAGPWDDTEADGEDEVETVRLAAARPDPDPTGPPRRAVAPPAGRSVADGLRSWRRGPLLVLAALLVLAIALAGVSVLRSRPVAVDAAAIAISGAAVPVGSATPSATASAPVARLVVHVIGEVARPGVVTLPAGSRVADAIEAAGGRTGDTDPGDLNLARVLADGEQIVVGSRATPGGEVRGGPSVASAGTTTGGAVNLNTASAADLEALPGVGPVTAAKILAWRDEHGGFTSVDQLQEVPGIGPKTHAQLAPLVTV